MTTHDLLITGGTVVDGTGAPGVRADVAISGDRIVAVGLELGPARETLDATGCLVTPGFIDLHTHFDGQATWDAEMAPSSWHGVTTAVMGSCGVGFAPVRKGEEDRLVDLMEGVEDIPGTALHEGIPWGWEGFDEYLDAVDGLPHAVDLMAHVPHDALRLYVMGERAARGEAATPADIDAMCAALTVALDAGAVGLSIGRTDNHRTAAGKKTPGAEVARAELMALAGVFSGRDRGVLQAVSDFDQEVGPERFDAEFDLVEDMSRVAGKPLSMSLMQRINVPGQWEQMLSRVDQANARGGDLWVQVAPRPIGVILGFGTVFQPFMAHPTYKALEHLPLAERIAKLREPAVREALFAERPDPMAGDGSPMPPLADELLRRIDEAAFLMFPYGDPPDYEPDPSTSLAMRASSTGQRTLEVLLDALCEDDGQALIYFAIFNYLGMNLDVVHQMLSHPRALMGLSDGGAHVGTICDASFPTTLLQWWARDRPGDQFPVEQVVYNLTARQADYLGLTDRGRVAEGLRADLNVVDHGALRLHRPTLVADLPAGGRRLLQRATGYRATVLGGAVTFREGVATGARPGRVVRLR